jgi:hypothetical protein
VAFDPDAYLANQSPVQDSNNFDPDKYLASTPQQYPSGSFPLNPLRVGMDVASTVSNLAPWNRMNQAYKAGVGNYAEFLGKHTNLPPAGIAAVTTPLAIAPELFGAVSSWEGIHDLPNPTIKGLVNTPQELGPEYEAQNAAIGVNRQVPLEGGRNATFPPPENIALTKQPKPLVGGEAQPLPSTMPIRYPSKPADFIGYANGRLQGNPSQLNPQELMDWQVKLQTDMSNGTIPKFDPNGRITTIFQQASDLLNRTRNQFNQVAEPLLQNADLPENVSPTRAGLNEAYGISSGQAALQRGIGKTATVGRKVGEGAAALYGLYQGGKRLISQ